MKYHYFVYTNSNAVTIVEKCPMDGETDPKEALEMMVKIFSEALKIRSKIPPEHISQ